MFVHIGMLFNSIRAAVEDEGFYLPSMEAQSALDSACNLLEWTAVPSNATVFEAITSVLVEQLNLLVKDPPTTNARKEKMWAGFSKYVSSTQYNRVWRTLSESAAVQLSPILNFFVTNHYFLCLLKMRFSLTDHTLLDTFGELSMDEGSALEYVGGYIVRALRKKIERSKHELMEEMVLALYGFLEDSEHCDPVAGDPDVGDSENPDWVTLIDRGGLLHCRTEFIQFLCAVELVVKQEMKRGNETAMKAGFKGKMTARVEGDEDVLFWWSTVCAMTDVDNETEKALLPLIADLFVTIRGFAFAARWMEVFKQQHKKSLQRSKGLRNKLQTPTT